jgi:sterol desaturase/sphingolipid hydroxylase (fatty acid hydroxylase superfamily)
MNGIENENSIRLVAFVGVFVVMAMLEFASPRKQRTEPRVTRWITNFGLVVVDAMVLRAVFPILAVGVAVWAQRKGYGLFAILDWPILLEITLTVIVLDFAIYWQHVASHKLPLLWRVHRVHHADRDLDASSGLRFHPVEIALSMIYKFAVIILLGAPPLGVFVFEVLLNGSAMFNHANFRLPLALDRLLRMFIVTPDMHRVHHSILRREADTNYGFALSIWDRMFGSYTEQPENGHDGMTLGLVEQQTSRPSQLIWCLTFPFRREK